MCRITIIYHNKVTVKLNKENYMIIYKKKHLTFLLTQLQDMSTFFKRQFVQFVQSRFFRARSRFAGRASPKTAQRLTRIFLYCHFHKNEKK